MKAAIKTMRPASTVFILPHCARITIELLYFFLISLLGSGRAWPFVTHLEDNLVDIETLTDAEIENVSGGLTVVAVIHGANGNYNVYNVNGVSIAVFEPK